MKRVASSGFIIAVSLSIAAAVLGYILSKEVAAANLTYADIRLGDYAAANAIVPTLFLLPQEQRRITAQIAKESAADDVAWRNCLTAEARLDSFRKDVYNRQQNPPPALFDEVVSAAHELLQRPSLWTLKVDAIQKRLDGPASTFSVRYSQPTPAAPVSYDVRLLSLSFVDPAYFSEIPQAAAIIQYRSRAEPIQANTVSLTGDSIIRDVTLADQMVLLPSKHGFALSFFGAEASGVGGSADAHIAHVVRYTPGSEPKYDGDALPSGVWIGHLSGLTATGVTDSSGWRENGPFNECHACAHLWTTASATWNGERYVLTSTEADHSAYAALVGYVQTNSTAFLSPTANSAHLRSLRDMADFHRGDGSEGNGITQCSIYNDSSNRFPGVGMFVPIDTPPPEIANVTGSCPGDDDSRSVVQFVVKAERTAEGYKLTDVSFSST